MFKGLGNLGNIASMVGSLQKLPDKLAELNERMKSETVCESSDCGQDKSVMTGTGQVQSIDVAPSLTGDALEQAILQATNAAGTSAKKLYAEAIRELAADLELNLPGIDSMLTSLTGGQ